MDSIADLHHALCTLIAQAVPTLRTESRRRFVHYLLAAMLAGTVVLRRCALTQAAFAFSTASAASHERRLRRTVQDPHLQAVPIAPRVVRRILQHLRPGMRVTLAVDETCHTDQFRILVAALLYRGRAVPVAWVLWPGQQARSTPFWDDCARVLADAAGVLPPGLRVTVVADRAFGCPAFTDLVQQHGWHYVVRVQRQTRFRHADGTEQPLSTLLTAPQQWLQVTGQLFKGEGWRNAAVVAYWRRGCASPLLLASSRPVAWDLVRVYRQRSWIEAMFRDWKSSGWHWEQSQVRSLAGQEVIVAVLVLATVLTLCLGEETAQAVVARGPQQGQRRPFAARDSLFRLGRDRLLARLWQQDRQPITWELRDADAPAWSFECWARARGAHPPVYVTERLGQRETRRAA